MASSNTTMTAFFISLIIAAVLSPAAAAGPPSSAPALSSDQGPFSFKVVPMHEHATDSSYLTADMTAAVKAVELFMKTEVAKRLEEPAADDNQKKCLSLCKEMFASAAESMKTAVESVDAGDYMKAAFDVSAFNSDVEECNDCGSPFGEFDKWAKSVASDCLDKIVSHNSPF